jgi:transposase
MEINAATLPDTPGELKEIIIGLHEAHEKETGILLEQIRHLRAQLFGRKSEKIQGGPQTLPLFDMPEPSEEDWPEEKVRVPAHDRRKRGRKPLPEALPRVEVVHDIDEADKICACGCRLTRIGEEVSEQLDIIPAKMQVIRHIRPKYVCKKCEGVEDDGPTVKIAPVPSRIIPRSIATPGLLAHILTAKFVDHTPFYRQEKQFHRLGVEISRTSMCSWAMQTATVCQPLLNLLIDEVLSGFLIQADETTLQVLMEPGRDPTTKSYMWIFRRGDPEKTVLVYQYHPTRGGGVAKTFLRDFKGCVQTDGYSGYDFLDRDENIRHIGCWAHARRKFMDVVKAQGKNSKSRSGGKAVSYIRKLYKIEKEAREKGLSPDEVYHLRQKESRPVLDDFKKWLLTRSVQVPGKGLLGIAISYTLNQWDRLVGYLEDGRLPIDNNMAENAIRPFVVGRKNWLFSGTPEGAEASALLYSLIETAKANKLEPYMYLRFIFEKLPTAASLQDFEALLPWNLTAKQLEVPQALKCA